MLFRSLVLKLQDGNLVLSNPISNYRDYEDKINQHIELQGFSGILICLDPRWYKINMKETND